MKRLFIFRSVFLLYSIEAPFGDQNYNRTWLEFLLLNKQNFCWLKQRPELCVENICILWSQIIAYISETITEGVRAHRRQSMMLVWWVWRSAGRGHPKATASLTALSAGLLTLDQEEKMEPDMRMTLWKWDCLIMGLCTRYSTLAAPTPCNIIFSSGFQSGNKKIYSFFKTCCRLFTILLSGNEHWNNLFYFVS